MDPADGRKGIVLMTAVMLVLVASGVSIVSYTLEGDGDVFGGLDYVALGDSVTYAMDGGTHERMDLPYPCLVNCELGFRTHTNLAVNGATVSEVSPGNNTFLQLDRIPAGTDIISVLIGGNDFLIGVPLGGPGDDTRDTVYGAYDSLMAELKERFPFAFVFFMTMYDVPLVQGDNHAGYSMGDMAAVLKEVCSKNSVPVLDLNSMVDFDMATDPDCDWIHPTQEFTERNIAPRISDFIEDTYTPVKRYVALGDSITYGFASDGRMDRPYPTLVAEGLGSVDCINLAVNGASVSNVRAPNDTMAQFDGVPADADIISVMIGVNDFASSAPLGDIDDITQDTVYGGLNMLADSLQRRCPDALIFFMTPFPFLGVDVNSAGYRVSDVADAVKEVCSLRGIPVLDMYSEGCFSMENDPTCDTLHPTQEFFERYTAPMIMEFIQRYI